MYRKNIRLASAIPDWTTLERIPSSERGESAHADMFKHITKEQVDRGVAIAQSLTEDLCSRLQQQLLLSFEPHRLSVSLMSSEEFVRRYSADMLVQTELGYPGHDPVHCLWDYSFAQSCINRITGGSGEAQIENEELTAIEKLIFEGVLQEALQAHARAWRSVFPPTPQRLSITAPKLGGRDTFPEGQDLVILGSEIKLLNSSAVYTLRWVYSAETFAQCIDQWKGKQRKGERKISLPPEAVSIVDVPVKAELGKAIVSMADILLLQRGDVIVLDKYINESVFVDVGSDARFTAQAGEYNGHLAVQLLQPVAFADAENLADDHEDRAATTVAFRDDQAKSSTLDTEFSEAEDEEPFDDVQDTEEAVETPQAKGDEEEDILDNIEDDDEEDADDEEFVWDEKESTDEDF